MIYQAGELLAYLKNLQLCGQDEEGEHQWCGEQSEWNNLKDDLKKYHEQ